MSSSSRWCRARRGVDSRYAVPRPLWLQVGSRKAPPMPQEERSPAPSADLTHTVVLPAWPVVVRALREAAGVNQEAWARALEVGRTTVQRWERGETVPDPTGQAQLLTQ